MPAASHRGCPPCASRGNSRKRASMARGWCRWARSRDASASSIAPARSSRSAITAGAACRWRCSWRRADSPQCITWQGAWMPGRELSTRLSRCTSGLVLTVAFATVSLGVEAQDLVQVYRDAQRYDAQYSSARYALEAGREKLPQGPALLLPSLNLQGTANATNFDSTSRNNTVAPQLSFNRDVRVTNYTFTLTQPLFRPQNWAQFGQAEFQVKQAEATFGRAWQDLMTRTAQAYFDVLAAQDTLALVRAQKAAISEQLAQAKRNFEVGTATITDTHEAQARFDLSAAQEIAAQNDLDSKRRSLQLLTGKEYGELKALQADIKLPQPNPEDMQSWVDLAEKQSYPVQVQEAGTAIAALEARRNSNAHLPTLDLVGSYGQTDQTATLTSPIGNTLTQGAIGLQLAMPLFAGGGCSPPHRQAAPPRLQQRRALDNARRSAALPTRQSYL